MAAYSRLRYGKTCDRCGAAITVSRHEPALCDDCVARETAARRDLQSPKTN